MGADALLQRPHHLRRAHLVDEVALVVALSAQVASVCDLHAPFGDRHRVLDERRIEVHSAHGKVADVLLVEPRRAHTAPEEIDLAHRVVAAVLGGRQGVVHLSPPRVRLQDDSPLFRWGFEGSLEYRDSRLDRRFRVQSFTASPRYMTALSRLSTRRMRSPRSAYE